MPTNSQSGFSIIELLLAAFLTVGLLGAIFAISNANQQIFVTESGVVELNQNARTAMDMLTRDLQTAGVGLTSGIGNLASLYYTQGANGAPDSVMMLNGDPFAPAADVDERAAGSATFFVRPPADLISTGNGANQLFTYVGYSGESVPIYLDYGNDPKRYIVYDDLNAMMFTLTSNGQTVGNGGTERIQLQHNPQGYLNPPSVFGTTIGTAEPNYASSKIAVLDSSVGYRVDTATRELQRTEDLVNWYTVARGVRDFQLSFRLVRRTATDAIEEFVSEVPGNGTDRSPAGETTSRADIHSVIVTIELETPGRDESSQHYRRVVHTFEVTPRNMNLLNNSNVRSGEDLE